MSTQTPAQNDVELVSGDDFTFAEEVKEGGSVVDFSQHSGEILQVRRGKSSSTELLDEYKTSDNSLTTDASGVVEAEFTASQTQDWPAIAFYQFQSTDGGGNKRTYIEGTIRVQRDIAS